jgi:hypothetical protein
MKITRRALFKLLGIGGLATFGRFGNAIAAPVAQPFFLVFDDLTSDTPVNAVDALLAPFSNLGIPVGFIVKPGDPASKAPLLSAFLRDFLLQSPDLGEIIAWRPDLAQQEPYFQVRHVTITRARLSAFLDLPLIGSFAPMTIAGDDFDGDLDVDAVRGAGFRNVMMLSQKSGGSVSDRCNLAVACMRGSVRHAISEDGYAIISSVRKMVGRSDMTVLALSLKQIDSVSYETLQLRAGALADAIAAEVQAGRIFAALPRQHVNWFSIGSTPLIGLAVETPPPDELVAQTGFHALQRALTLANIPFSLIGEASDISADTTTYCRRFVPPLSLAHGSVDCIAASGLPAVTLQQLADGGTSTIVQPDADGMIGLDDNGLLYLPEIPFSVVGMGAPGLTRDIVLTIPAKAYATDEQRAAIIGALQETAGGNGQTILDIPRFAKAILPQDPVYNLMLATRRDMANATAATVIGELQRAALIEDAKIAWSYFDQMTDPATGLCASTVYLDGEWSSINRVLTMWDYGSLVQATMTSHELGLIDDQQYVQRAEAILRGLPAERIGGFILPSSEISSDTGKSVAHDYNACDTGRLLIALDQMNRHRLSKDWFTEKVATWELARTLQDGQLNSISQGQFRPFARSQCTHYATRAFGLWGIEARSPYDSTLEESKTDGRMRLLYRLAQFGAFGAEPLLLEAIELGFSEPSAYMADVLFLAQSRSFAANGILIAASEGPMDRPPWFTYQGLKVDADRDFWDVQSIDSSATFQSPDFRAEAQVFSTKAAFLWAALRPGAYSTLLLDYARKHARASDIGYSSGVYTATDTGMKNYTDINTNGIILQAVAYSLRGAVSDQSNIPPATDRLQ